MISVRDLYLICQKSVLEKTQKKFTNYRRKSYISYLLNKLSQYSLKINIWPIDFSHLPDKEYSI